MHHRHGLDIRPIRDPALTGIPAAAPDEPVATQGIFVLFGR